MKNLLLLCFILLPFVSLAQDKIEWSPEIKIQLEDFQSDGTEIGNTTTYSVNVASGFTFSFSMSRYEFMFTKNFNTKVDCSFDKKLSYLVAPDTMVAQQLVAFAQFQFDLSELYARKFRKELYEQKGTFSNVQFFQESHDKIQEEYSLRLLAANKSTDMGEDKIKLAALRAEVLEEINQLQDFCKSCKTPKKVKK